MSRERSGTLDLGSRLYKAETELRQLREAYGRLERDYWEFVRDNQDLQTRAAQRPIAGALQEGHPDARRLQPGKLEKVVRSPL